jgi:hypothetical protein
LNREPNTASLASATLHGCGVSFGDDDPYPTGTFFISAVASIVMVLVYLYAPVGDTALLLLGIPLNASILMKFAPMGPFMTELYPTEIRGTGCVETAGD